MPLLQRLSKQVGCRIWDAIQAKLKEIQQKDKINKTLVDYIFVLFDPCNDATVLRSKLVDFLGDKTDVFVEWFVKVVSQVDNQVTKAQSEIAGKQSSAGAPEGTAATTKPTPCPEKDTSTVPTVKTDPPSEAQPPVPAATSGSESPHKTEADKRREAEAENDWESDPSRSRHHHRSCRRREHRGTADPNREQPKSGVSRISPRRRVMR